MDILFWIIFLGFVSAIFLGIKKGWGADRTIIVFRDYDDLGLSFLVCMLIALFVFYQNTFGFGLSLGSVIVAGLWITATAWLAFKLVVDTYEDNARDLKKATFAFVTKVTLGTLGIIKMMELLGPNERGSGNRAHALVVLTLLTPILGMLVVNKSGQFFNPREWIKGRRVGGAIRHHL